MNESIYARQRKEGYRQVLAEIQKNKAHRTEFENAIKEKIYRWWSEWVPDYEGWLKISDRLYADQCVVDAIGETPQIYPVYRAAMKRQRDIFTMDMGPIDRCLVEGDTLAIGYNMYLTARATTGTLKAGATYKIKVAELNKFAYVEGCREPMVVDLLLTATTPGVAWAED